jgi:hypothetical protein
MNKKLQIMRNLIQLILIIISIFAKGQIISITNNSGTNSITCLTQSINMTASCVGFSTVSTFSWFSPFSSSTGSNVNINSPSTYTVITMNGSMMVLQTFTVFQNIVPPVSSISSTFLIISGTVVPTMTMVAINPTTNIQHVVYSPTGGTLAANSTTMYYTPSGPGTYTYCVFWQVNGCSSCKTFTISKAPTSLTQYAREDPIKVYQNSSGEICVKGTKETVLSLYDLSGRCLRNLNLEEGTGFCATFVDIKPGLYVLVSVLEGRKLRVVVGNP